MKSAVIVYPGSNCDRDIAVALEAITGHKPLMVWHDDHDFPEVDFIALPGGFPTAIICVPGPWRRAAR